MEKRAFGICLGASTISAVEVLKTENGIKIERVLRKHHEGNPRKEFENVLSELNTGDSNVLITGRKFREFVNLPSIPEPEATEYALSYVAKDEKYDVLVSAGGETFMVYNLDDNHKIIGVTSGNKCASGTGEFFLQQIKRMNLDIEKAVKYAEIGEPYTVSGRCSVFCKSDCTHALNKGELIENVTAGLCKMIAGKIVELVEKFNYKKVLVVGGTALNRAVIKFLKQKINDVYVPKEAPYFEALGAALCAFEKGKPIKDKNLFFPGKSSFTFLEPLKNAMHLVKFNKIDYANPEENDKCIIGLDVGSTTTKAVLMRVKDNRFLASVYLRTNGNPVEASRECYKSILNQLKGVKVNIVGIGVTGSGRHIAGLYSLTDGIINEIIAHASASAYFDPQVDTIFEIGGQDAKYTHLTNSVASDYAMNEACSAGTGSFLEESAFESFGVKTEDIAELALKGDRPPNFNDQCAAFISSDIKNASHEGISRENILAGLVYSICFNYINRVKGHRPVGDKIFMQGGVCYNKAVPLAMAAILKKPIIVPPEPGLMGAFGVALELKKRIELGLVHERQFSLQQLIERQVIHEKPFICAGGKEKCDLKCNISRVKIENKIYAFGGACNRYYNLHYNIDVDSDEYDFVKKRNYLMYEKYAPVHSADKKALTIGLNKSLLTHNLFPLYYNFFTNLGCKIIVPDKLNEGALSRQTTSFCYPAQIAIMLFDNLVEKNPDYYFIPQVRELFVPFGNTKPDFCATCIFSQGESFWMASLYRDKNLKNKILDPLLNFREGYEKEEKVFINIAKKLGFSASKAKKAFKIAVEVQREFEKECKLLGKKAIELIKSKEDGFGFVLLGRPHNAFTEDANKGIPRKITTRGYVVIPYEMLDFEKEKLEEPFNSTMHWEIGQKILKSSQVIKKDKNLFFVYITNFLCAIDSFLAQHARRVMGTKPSLTLELDGHTADAGINTRIDAYIDVIKNYIQVQKKLEQKKEKVFMPSKIITENNQCYFVDSSGKKFSLSDPNVKVILPPMNDYGNRALAAAMQKVGINAYALPRADSIVRRLGRGVLTGKECIPLVVCLGSWLKYLEYDRKPGEKVALFIPKAHGYCRLGQYFVTAELLVKEKQLVDTAPFYFAQEVGYTGLGPEFSIAAWKAIVISDIFNDIRNALYTLAVDVQAALDILEKEFSDILDIISGRSKENLYKKLEKTAKKLKEIKLRARFDEVPMIAVNGEIFVRSDSWCNNDIAKMIAAHGFIARHASIHEWLFYNNYLIKKGIFKPEYKIKDWIEFYISDMVMLNIERKIKNIIIKSGLYDPEIIDVSVFSNYSEHIIPERLTGEPVLSTGKLLKDSFDKYAGFINIGPFGCMITRYTEAVASKYVNMQDKIEAYKRAGKNYKTDKFDMNEKIPFLTIEVDGNPYPQLLLAKFESFCLQSERIAKKQGKKPIPRPKEEELKLFQITISGTETQKTKAGVSE